MILHPYFIFNGEAREAITFYANALGITHGEINTYGQLVDRFGLHWMMNFDHQQ